MARNLLIPGDETPKGDNIGVVSGCDLGDETLHEQYLRFVCRRFPTNNIHKPLVNSARGDLFVPIYRTPRPVSHDETFNRFSAGKRKLPDFLDVAARNVAQVDIEYKEGLYPPCMKRSSCTDLHKAQLLRVEPCGLSVGARNRHTYFIRNAIATSSIWLRCRGAQITATTGVLENSHPFKISLSPPWWVKIGADHFLNRSEAWAGFCLAHEHPQLGEVSG